MSREQAKVTIEKLVERFDEHLKDYHLPDYNEQKARQDFINPFFKALGWDIDNEKGDSEAYREVIYEDKVVVRGKSKAPDYGFRLSGSGKKRLFYVEAKKPSVPIKTNKESAYQLRRYGSSAQAYVSILTNFEDFIIYDCSKVPNLNDSATVARLKHIGFKDYIKEFDFLYDTFSHEAVTKGRFDKYVQASANKKGTDTLDKRFVESLDQWRKYLATGFAGYNKKINDEELNFAVQQTIDRLIFLRFCEDRSIEPYGRLQLAASKGDSYKNLFQLFKEADDKYNSGLFDFEKDKITPTLKIDNKVIKAVIDELYFPKCNYEFSVMPVEILGNAYEQFLGKVIRITPSRGVKIEEKPEVRKAGGVYYTPQYIVDYIVKNTLGKLIYGKSPKAIETIKIVDPACGSGSFLVGAYQYLLDWHSDFYYKEQKRLTDIIENGNSALKEKKQLIKDRALLPLTPDGKLTTKIKKQILVNNFHGVDLDANAVEVTKLSLLLKCMEGETEASIKTITLNLNDRVLPNLDNNIKDGNSLIDRDSEFDFETDSKIKPFNWKKSFPSVFKQGGFDIVIGNPPYGAEIPKEQQKYLLKKFPISSTETAALFMVLAQSLLVDKGYNGFIVPKAFTYASNYEKTRTELLNDLNLIVDCSKVWREVKLEMSIYISQKKSNTKDYFTSIRIGTDIKSIGKVSKRLCKEFNFFLNGLNENEIQIGKKIANSPLRLHNVVSNRRGAMLQSLIEEKGNAFIIGGKQVQPYRIDIDNKRKVNRINVLDATAVISQNCILVQNIVAHVQNPKPHIFIIATVPDKKITETCVLLDTVNQLQNKSEYSPKFILGVLNSDLIGWYVYRFVYANAIRTMHFDSSSTDKIPFPSLDMKVKNEKVKHDEVVKHVEQIMDLQDELKIAKLATKVDQIKSRISYSEEKINQIVNELFSLTKEEAMFIE